MIGAIFVTLLIIIIAVVSIFILYNLHNHHEKARIQLMLQHRSDMDKMRSNVKSLNTAVECVTKQTCKNKSKIKTNKNSIQKNTNNIQTNTNSIQDQKKHFSTKKITVGDFSIAEKQDEHHQPVFDFQSIPYEDEIPHYSTKDKQDERHHVVDLSHYFKNDKQFQNTVQNDGVVVTSHT